MKRKTKENLSLSENIFLLCTIIYYIALYRQRKVCLVDQEEGRSERGLRLGQKEGWVRLGQELPPKLQIPSHSMALPGSMSNIHAGCFF